MSPYINIRQESEGKVKITILIRTRRRGDNKMCFPIKTMYMCMLSSHPIIPPTYSHTVLHTFSFIEVSFYLVFIEVSFYLVFIEVFLYLVFIEVFILPCFYWGVPLPCFYWGILLPCFYWGGALCALMWTHGAVLDKWRPVTWGGKSVLPAVFFCLQHVFDPFTFFIVNRSCTPHS